MDSANGASPRRFPQGANYSQRTYPTSRRDDVAAPEPLRPSGQSSQLVRAQKYEDEKARIINSCFSKTTEEGKLLMTYITHIRVVEDGAYPSTPPPPEAPAHYKKPRVIIAGVKNTGRVQMYKARENDDASFQIGKTWNIDELQAVEIFSRVPARTPEEQQQALWAGNTGFTITMAKPYFWQAEGDKEMLFFVNSLVAIYKQYTHGSVPKLVGFPAESTQPNASSRESPNRAVQNPSPRPPQLNQSNASTHPTALATSSYPSSHDRSNIPIGSNARSISSSQHPNPPPGWQGDSSSNPFNQSQDIVNPVLTQSNRPLRTRPSQESSMRSVPSREQMRNPRIQSPPMAMSGNLTPKSSHSNFASDTRSGLDVSTSNGGTSRRDLESSTLRPEYRGGAASNYASSESLPINPQTTDQWRSNTGRSQISDRYQTPPESFHAESNAVDMNGQRHVVPERRRPPLQESEYNKTREPSGLSTFSNNADPNSVLPLAPKPLNTYSRPSTGVSAVEDVKHLAPTKSAASFQDEQVSLSSTTPPLNEQTKRAEVELPVPGVDDRNNINLVSKPEEPVELPTTPPDVEEQKFSRPGLGPMLGKKQTPELANKFRKAATAYGAFKPRAGGAGERLLASKNKMSNEPDGVTSVVPAPSFSRQEPVPNTPIEVLPTQTTSPEEPERLEKVPSSALGSQLAASAPIEEAPIENAPKEQPVPEETHLEQRADMPAEPRARVPPKSIDVRKERRSNKYAKALTALEIDPLVLDGREINYDEVLTEFGWDENFLQARKVETLEINLRREIGRLEAGSWLGHSDHRDDGVEVVEKLLDKAIRECDEMEGLLTLYSVELGTLNDDIAYIEAQSQGLQVQTANQKLLQMELQGLVDTISIDASHMEPLQRESLKDSNGLGAIEACLLQLYKALTTIDPASFKNSSLSANSRSLGDSNLTSMRALQEKKDIYLNQTYSFLDRMKNYMDPTFGAAFMKTTDALSRNGNSSKALMTLDVANHDLARNSLWQYSPLMLFAKEVDNIAWEDMLRIYQNRAAPVYSNEIRNSLGAWSKTAKKPTADEQNALFTAQEKETESYTAAARKMTVKRSHTLARGLRTGTFEKRTALGKSQEGTLDAFESFAGALDEIVPLIYTEQNFIVEFFHVTSLENTDFVEAVEAAAPEHRKGINISSFRGPEPDRIMAERVTEVMTAIFSFWPIEMQALIDRAIKDDPLQIVGIICSLERKRADVEDTNQDFLLRAVSKVHDHLTALFTRFVDDQIRAIEDTKVKIKKRKGVIGFIKVFPNFSAIIENMAPPMDGPERLEVRGMIDAAYDRIIKSMFDSLKVIAKESPLLITNGVNSGMTQSADPDDKEALNYHILLIENMFHFYEEVEERGDALLGEWRGNAMLEYSEHEALYVDAVIRRPLGKALDFLESMDSLLMSSSGRENAASIAVTHSSHSRSVFKKLLAANDAKEVRHGVSKLRQRIEKHFGEADDPSIAQKLVSKILAELERRYVDVLERLQRVASQVYEGSVEIEFSKADISQAFRR